MPIRFFRIFRAGPFRLNFSRSGVLSLRRASWNLRTKGYMPAVKGR